MDINVTVTLEAGRSLAPLATSFANLLNSAIDNAVRMVPALEKIQEIAPRADATNEPQDAEKESPKTRRPRGTRTAKDDPAPSASPTDAAAVPEENPSPVEEQTLGDRDMTDEEKLEAIRSEITVQVKKGGVDNVKGVLAHFSVKKASELTPEQYDAALDAMKQLASGEALEEILNDDLA